MLRGFLDGIHHSQVRLDLRKTLEDKDMNVDKAIERALHLEALTRKEEEEQVPQIGAIRRNDSNKSLVEAVNGLVQKLSGTAEGSSGKTAVTAKAGLTHDAGIRDRITSTKTNADPKTEKLDSPTIMKTVTETSTIHVLDADKQGIELNSFGTVFIPGVSST